MNQTISFAYIFFSILFIVLISATNLSVHWLLKIIPILILWMMVWRAEFFKHRLLLLGALTASVVGDILLHRDLFVLGLSAFLIAQIQYAFLFYQFRKLPVHRLGLSFILLIYLVGMLVLLIPNLGEMMIPVFGYLIAISAMGFLAIQSSLPIKWAVLGALVFILSDSLIAANKFMFEVPHDRLFVMSTYYAAQWLLVSGFLSNKGIFSE